MRKSAVLLALAALAAPALALPSCFSSQNEPAGVPDGATFDDAATPDAEPDAPAPAVEAGPDATLDSTAPADAAPDQTLTEDAGEDAAAASPEPSAEAATEAASPEAGPDATLDAALDASVDALAEASDASDGSTFCIAQIFGDHYIRPDGELFYGTSGSHTLVVNAASSSPLLGMSEIVQQQDHACGLRSDGTVWCWALTPSAGFGNANGDLGNGSMGGTNLGVGVATQVVTTAADAGAPSYLTNVAHLSTASDTFYTFPTCAIRTDKTVWCWGYSAAETGSNDGLYWGTTGSVASIPYAIPIAAAASDGGPPPVVTADQVSVGFRHACVLLAGKVSCWGQNVAGNLADGDPTLAFKPYPVPVVTGYGLPSTVDAIGSGFDFSCALAGGSVWCWGTVSANEVGNPSAPIQVCNSNYCLPTPTPVQATGADGGSTQIVDGGVDQNPLTGIASFVVGYQFACGLDTSASVWCWGAYVAGSTNVLLATPYTSGTAPYTGVTRISAYGEGVSDGLRYTTASGVYVAGGQVHAPYCQ